MELGTEDWARAFWFRLEIKPMDLSPWVQLRGDWGHDNLFFEALAQVILVMLRSQGRNLKGTKVHQWCDNETTVLAVKKGLATAEP